MVEELADRHSGGDGEVGGIGRDLVIEDHGAFVDELEQHHGDEGFGDASDSEESVSPDGITVCGGDTRGVQLDGSSGPGQGDGHATGATRCPLVDGLLGGVGWSGHRWLVGGRSGRRGDADADARGGVTYAVTAGGYGAGQAEGDDEKEGLGAGKGHVSTMRRC